ncbi:MAG: DUF2339 domain-containing protein [Planctomycetes bacterium]|nr:DUF2339 domain-containing protein [Planctomycetota bacterium]
MTGIGESQDRGTTSGLREELAAVQRQIAQLAERVAALEQGAPRPEAAAEPQLALELDSESAWGWLTRSRVLTRVAAVSFALVVALVLRTLADAGALGTTPGVALGLAYAAGLMAWGTRRRAPASTLGSVLATCGVVLLCTVVLEGQARFGVVPTPLGNAILALTLVLLAVTGVWRRAALVMEIATLAVAVTTVALGFPTPHFASAAATLLLAAAVASLLLGTARRPWVHWVVLLPALFFWLTWTFKLAIPLRRGLVVPAEVQQAWFLPSLAATLLGHLALAARRAAAAPAAPGPFAMAMPAFTVVWAQAAAAAVVLPWLGHTRALGGVVLAVAVVCLAVAVVLRHRSGAAAGFTAFALAATCALAPALAWVLAEPKSLAAAWSLTALGLALVAQRHGSGSLRLVSYLLQAAACAAAVVVGEFAAPAPSPVLDPALAVFLAASAWLHYSWCRRHPPPATSWYGRVAGADRLAVLLVWIAAASAFCALRLVAWPTLSGLPIDVDNAFHGAQSVGLHLIAIALMGLGLFRRSRELLVSGVILAVLGGLKVFGSDMLVARGVPLVLSVFSFGVAVGVASLVLGRWQKRIA